MRTRGPILACVLLVLANVYVLVGVAWNRSGEPEAELVLTERELTVDYRGSDEDTAIALKLEWGQWGEWTNETVRWFDQAKLEAIGFDCSLPPGMAGASEFYRRQLSRQTWIVFEYDGKAFEKRVEFLRNRIDEVSADLERQKETLQSLESARQSLDRARNSDSRLVAVDAGNDAPALRARYADRRRYLILPASVRASADEISIPHRGTGDSTRSGSPYLAGWIERILTDRIDVPLRWRPTLAALRSKPVAAGTPRYEVTLRTGRRLEPWIVAIRPLGPSNPS